MATKCIRLLCALGVLSCLPACAPIVGLIGYSNSVLQVAVQIDRIKLAGDGVSYLGSGKTITDHAVSKMVGADCRLMNVVSPDPVCKPKPNEMADKLHARMTLAAVREDLLQVESRFNGFQPGATADDGATIGAQVAGAEDNATGQ